MVSGVAIISVSWNSRWLTYYFAVKSLKKLIYTMKNKDINAKMKIEGALQSSSAGQDLISYFESLPYNKIRRAMAILSAIYPNKTNISDDDFGFITYIFSQEKFLMQESFFEFIRALNTIEFTVSQKNKLIDMVKEDFVILCKTCTFELDSLLIKIFNHFDLFLYFGSLSKNSDAAVLQHILSILKCEDLSHKNISDLALETLKEEVSQKL